MRILNVNMSLDPVTGGGTAERTLQLSKAMARAGVDCSILTTSQGLPESVRDIDGIDLNVLACWSERFYLPFFRAKQLTDIIKPVDLVHITNHWTVLNAIVYRACKKLDKPYVVCPAGALPIYGRSSLLKKMFNALVGRELIRGAAGYIAISPNEIPNFGEYGVAAPRVTVIPNGVSPADFEDADVNGFRRKHGLGDEPFILFVGRLNHIKGPDLLLEAFFGARDSLGSYQLVYVGPDGGMQKMLEERAVAFGGAEKVHFLGYLGGKEKSQAYHAADLLVIPSRQEAMSIVALEAGICGTPVLLTDQCGFDEVGEIGGGLVVSASREALCDGLIEMCRSPEVLAAMGERLKTCVLADYTWDAAVKKYTRLYRRILGEAQAA